MTAKCTFAALFSLLILALGCSKSTDPDTNKPPDTSPVGVLLSGTDTDPALSGTTNHGPFAVPAEEWNGDFVTTRLEAVINPRATVGAVNTALNSVGAKISCMRAGLVFTELVVGALPSADSAQVICSILVASGTFLSAYPCFDPTAGNDGAVMPDYPASIRITPLEEAKFPAAWNLRDRVAALGSPVTVVVADDFASRTPHPEIPAQTFLPGGGGVDSLLDSRGVIVGNHGFAVAGTIGARFDSLGSTGAFADPSNILRLPCICLSGLGSWASVMTEIFVHLPVGQRFVLNTSFGYPPDFSQYPKRRIIEHAFYWRSLVALRQGDFLHTQSSGNSGLASPAMFNADYNSPFTLAARFDTPFQMLQGTEVATSDTAVLTALYAQALVNGAIYGTKLSNVLTVGSSDWSGNLSTFSNLPSDVKMIGEHVILPCAMGDGLCSPATDVAWQGSFDGTSFSSPQVAALAAWLWALSPSLTVNETIDIIKDSYYSTYKWVDAYRATLSLDHTLSNAGIRLSLLDIAGANSQIGSDLKFDEKDLKMVLDSIAAYEATRNASSRPWVTDHSSFDLNGDGYTGDTALTPSNAPFDLTADTPPVLSSITATYCDGDTTLDEHALTDMEILKYYAFSSLYTGDSHIRDSLFECGASTPVITFLSRRSYAYANAGKFSGTTFSCPPSTAADTSSLYTEGPFIFAVARSYACPDEQGAELVASSNCSGYADPGFVSGAASAVIEYDVSLNTSVIGKSGVYMSAWGGHLFELRFQIEGAAVPFVAECADAAMDSQDKLDVSLSREGSGTVFGYSGGPGNPSQSFGGILEPGVYTFLANRDIHLTSSEQATDVSNGSVQVRIDQTATPLGSLSSQPERSVTRIQP